MSMIYGFINLDGRPADPAILKNMESALADKKHDAQSALVSANVAMGFKNQYITEESHFEALPYHDAETGLYFVCDAIIDNREELAALLGLRLTKETPDGRFIFEAYKKWGERCTDHLLGDFAFIVYDSRNRRAQLFRDHMGKRILYYRVENNCVFFSTLMKPLIDPWGSGQKPELNEEYLVFFLAIYGVLQEFIPGSTIYKDITYVFPASCLTAAGGSLSNEVYWEPFDIRPDRRMKKADYVEEFREIFREAVRCRLRVDGNVGVKLSGGLDSSAVACVAAGILWDQNKELHTYTAVPVQGFTDWTPRHIIADESNAVKLMQATYPNINAHFVDSRGMNSLNIADRMIRICEQPYKFIQNSYWLDEICRISSNDGCKVILNGSFGNTTISYGNYRTTLYEHLIRWHFIRFILDFNAFCHNNNVGRKAALIGFLSEFTKSLLGLFDRSDTDNISGLINPTYMRKYDVIRRLQRFGFTNKPIMSDKQRRKFPFHTALLSQASSFKMKSGLAYGLCERDPTADKRVVEFCQRLPYDCFFDRSTGQDRGLVRRAMSGIVPDEILRNWQHGLQAADLLERIAPQWCEFLSGFHEKLNNDDAFFGYLDMSYIKDLIARYSSLSYNMDTIIDVHKIITIDNCIQYVNMLI